ncbi:hypothetical protein [Oceanobacillus rekensis]|uniref:hypothetical protein n=1 Tax=Oceanobacillus rekensis TaxID=937927 RepID=UPI00111F13F0|nr:hypothetical protein [Oceanobacillus rekensis]
MWFFYRPGPLRADAHLRHGLISPEEKTTLQFFGQMLFQQEVTALRSPGLVKLCDFYNNH